MVFAKKSTKAPAVMVETKKMSAKDTCCGNASGCYKFKHLLMFVLVILNTIMIGWILCNQAKIEADRVGGRANYKMVRQIYKSPAFKTQQATQIQQALQLYQQGGTQQAAQQAVQQAPTPTAGTPVVAQ